MEGRWGELDSLVWLYGLLVATSLVGAWWKRLDPGSPVGPWTTSTMLLIVSVFVARSWSEVRPMLVVRWPRRRTFRWTLLAVATFFVVMLPSFAAMEHLGVRMIRVTNEHVVHGWPPVASYLLIAIVAPLSEEMAFRGLIQTRLTRWVGDREAWWVQAALFGVVHLLPLMFLTHSAMGLVLGWIRRRTESLYPGMLVHALWNGWVVWNELAETTT